MPLRVNLEAHAANEASQPCLPMALGITTVRARLYSDNTGSYVELPVLLSKEGLIISMIEYQSLFCGKSLSWQRNLCNAVRLLLEFASANRGVFKDTRDLFETFSIRLKSGTFGPDGTDPSGIYWLPRTSSRSNVLICMLTEFSKWSAKTYGVPEINPLRDATSAEKILAAAAWANHNKACFLGHAASKAKALSRLREIPWVPRHRQYFSSGEQRPRFPEEHFFPLIFRGFVVHPGVADVWLRLDLRCILITLLQHGGSLRVSECFHLWVHDVQPDPIDKTVALVRIGHPSEGLVREPRADGSVVEITRAEYLAQRGLFPRNLPTSRRRAGWKNPALTDRFLRVFWRSRIFGELFLHCWKLYLFQRIEVGTSHPWAFVNFAHNIGSPYTLPQYRKAHYRAVQRIGLNPRKSEGTTPHGHRHRCLFELKAAGVDSQIIQKVAHHCSMDSQEIYTEPEAKTIQDELYAVNARINSDRNSTFGGIGEEYQFNADSQ